MRTDVVELLAAIEPPQIVVAPGEAPKAADAAEEILLQHPELRFFQRAGQLVRLATIPNGVTDKHLMRPAGTVIVQGLTQSALLEALDRLVLWAKPCAKVPIPIDCPKRIAEYLLSRGEWRLPILIGTIFAPVLRGDGSVLNQPGYDPATGLYLVDGEHWPELPDEPTQEDARIALEKLLAPFSQFPFCSEVDRAVHAAAILTAVQRRMLPFAPLFGYDAPAQRTGKSMLAEGLGIIALGRKPAASAASHDEEEFRKVVLASLFEGHAVVNFDNVERPLGSPFLAQAITQEIFSDRILGETRKLALPTRTLWTATGNNLAFKGDLAVRAVVCRIDAGCERPEQRVFKIPDLERYLLDNRKELVMSALTVMRAYWVAGQPDQNLLPWGGFDRWTQNIRQPLVWVGMADPVASREAVIADDPDKTNATVMLTALWEAFDATSFTLREVIELANSPGKNNLLEALKNVAPGRKGDPIDNRALGWWCRKHTDRVIASLRLRKSGEDGHRFMRWRIERVP